jgi:voltage-gated potassium channel
MYQPKSSTSAHWRSRLFTVIFESDTKAGKIFDIALLIMIVISLIVVLIQGTPSLLEKYNDELYLIEWGITIIFTIEYILRILAVKEPWRYVFSLYGLIDLLAILPTFLSILFPQTRYLLVIRALRLMRVFRIFKLTHFVKEGMAIVIALKASSKRILVFLAFIMVLSVILGSIVYVVEAPYNEQFHSIPQSIYWCIVTITTVGYGDISPVTPLGKFIASLIMILGYAIIAVPTGIVTVEMSKGMKAEPLANQSCPSCSKEGHDHDAKFCKYCGQPLHD